MLHMGTQRAGHHRWGIHSRCNSIIEENIHPPFVDLGDGVAPGLDRAKMLVKQGGVEGGIAVRAPRLIHQDGAGQVDSLSQVSISEVQPEILAIVRAYLDAHSL